MDVSQLLQEVHGRVRPLVEETLEDLGPEELTWAPASGANTIGWLVWHLTRVQDHHLAEVLADSQVLVTFGDRFGRAPDPQVTGYGDGPADVASVRPESAQVLLDYHAAVQQRLMALLARLSPQELDAVVDDSFTPPVTLGVRLVSVAEDALQHAGQAAYVRGLLPSRSGSIAE